MTSARPDEKIEIDATRMIEGLVELLDELADLAINRIVLDTKGMPGGFDPGAIGQPAIDRFKIHWFAGLGELMFHGLAAQPSIAEVRALFAEELDAMARVRAIPALAGEARAAAAGMIAEDDDFNADGLFAAPRDDDAARYRGLGADFAAAMVAASFGNNPKIAPILEKIAATVEAEFVNAYGHSARACSRFVIV